MATTEVQSIKEEKKRQGLKICNYSDININVVVGVPIKGITTYGWFGIDKGSCQKVFTNKLKYRYYWIFVSSRKEDKHLLSKDRLLCIKNGKAFEINYANSTCYEGKNVYFKKIDTGSSGTGFKFTIN